MSHLDIKTRAAPGQINLRKRVTDLLSASCAHVWEKVIHQLNDLFGFINRPYPRWFTTGSRRRGMRSSNCSKRSNLMATHDDILICHGASNLRVFINAILGVSEGGYPKRAFAFQKSGKPAKIRFRDCQFYIGKMFKSHAHIRILHYPDIKY